ncbi:unnamed protein product [Kuraishia capsulata CBS 1993]|uniref:Uncharacterized protein n=1 Tax=Kuraishia capsulata CBS 1993 TaxID=1382522 RepID=W6MLZ4_9ASCO|nr:uncharacterized protein KUCA_T00003489001 [Kuraishia capsulata CBS 1993]CDK27511.1 unnamed protein product [Kuraishia capsulata CBS 1993]
MDVISLQPSANEVISDVKNGIVNEDEFWIKLNPSPLTGGENAIIQVKNENQSLTFTNKLGNMKLRAANKAHELKLEVSTEKVYDLRIPKKSYTYFNNVELTGLDIFEGGRQIVIGDTNGALTFGKINSHNEFEKSLTLEAHFADIVKVLFFPSGKVVLTAGLDYQIKIWNFEDGQNPRTMRKHTNRITDLAIIGRGRNFLSSSLDGSIVVWECGSGKAIDEMRRVRDLSDPVNCICVFQDQWQTSNSGDHQLFFEMEGKICYAGHESGVISTWDMTKRLPLGEYAAVDGGAVSSIAIDSRKRKDGSHLIITGYSTGYVRFWSSLNHESPLHELKIAKDELEDRSIGSLKMRGSSLIVTFSREYIVEIELKVGQFESILPKTFYVGLDQAAQVNQTKIIDNGLFVAGRFGLFARF